MSRALKIKNSSSPHPDNCVGEYKALIQALVLIATKMRSIQKMS